MPSDTERAIQQNEQYSIREFYPGTWGGLVGDNIGLWYPAFDILPAWGTYACDFQLRMFHYSLFNTLWQGAANVFIQRILSTPYEISGGRNQTYRWQDLFMESDFGEGYDYMMSKALTDYLTLNRGMFLEKVSYGNPDTPLKEGAKILGLNHLDALRIVFTGNREYPFVYYSEETGRAHRLHHTRVIHLAQSPSPDTRMFGMGKSALYDVIGVASSQTLMGRYHNEMLSDVPPSGMVLFENIRGEDVQAAMLQFEGERRLDGQKVYRAPMRLEGKDPSKPVKVTFVPMAQTPPDFDRQKYMDIDVNLMALGTGLDPQDIWPLTGQNLGTGTQSKVLAAKIQNRGTGYTLTRLERVWNTTLPRGLEWKYKAQNHEQDLETAAIAEKWTGIIRDATYLTEEEKRRLAANQIPAFADVLLDAQGNVRLPDDDPKDEGQEVAPDDVELDTELTEPTEETTADDNLPVEKEYDATKSAFESDLAALFADAAEGGVSKTAFKARLRTAINTYGKAAYLDGLETGGVSPEDYDETDSAQFAALLAEQSVYVSNVANEIYVSETGMKGSPEFKASLWVNKTLNGFYYAGVESADKNGLYTFTGHDGAESCKDCKALKGKTHRMSWWVKNRKRPGLDTANFECGGWQCQHYLERKTAKSLHGLTREIH